MKFIKWKLILITCFIFFSNGQAFAFQNEPEGFRGIKWGTDMSDMVYIMTGQEQLGGVKFESPEYQFNNAKFCGIDIHIKNQKDAQKMLSYLKKKYGKGNSSGPLNSINDVIVWSGENTTIFFMRMDKYFSVNFRSTKMLNYEGYYLFVDNGDYYYLKDPTKIDIVPFGDNGYVIGFWFKTLFAANKMKSGAYSGLAQVNVLFIEDKPIKYKTSKTVLYSKAGKILYENNGNKDYESIPPRTNIDNVINSTINYCMENNLIPKE